MSDEAAFLAAIAAAPADALPRLVYADWLEERGDSRAEFLRLQQQLADALDRLQHARVGLASEWLEIVLLRRDIVLHAVAPAERRNVIKILRYQASAGRTTDELLTLIENLPAVVVKGVPLQMAERLRQQLMVHATVTIEIPTTN